MDEWIDRLTDNYGNEGVTNLLSPDSAADKVSN